jgi:high-affinity K+ transport system ATPase subunit B
MSAKIVTQPIWDMAIIKVAMRDAFTKLHPRDQARNPVMFMLAA